VPQDPPTTWYDTHAGELAHTYESIQAAKLHAWMGDLLPAAPALAADIGAGTGRDAAWLASRGLDVVAVEPSVGMREQAALLHPDANVRWLADSLPDLRELLRMGLTFDLILLSAVWMHVPIAERPRAFRKLVTLLKPGGLIAISLRSGPSEPERGMQSASEEDIGRLAREQGASIVRRREKPSEFGRLDVSWIQLAVRLTIEAPGRRDCSGT
jgi:SAM-dependent methyltransferase